MAGLEPRQLQNGSHLGCDKFSSFKNDSYTHTHGNSPVGQWLRFRSSNAGSKGSTPGRGTKIPHALGCCQKQKNKNPEYTPSYHLMAMNLGLFVTPVLIYWGTYAVKSPCVPTPSLTRRSQKKTRQSPYPPEKDSLCHGGALHVLRACFESALCWAWGYNRA